MNVGDKFWLLPAPINPLVVHVTIQEVSEKGYLVDEPVGFVSNPNCIFETRKEAEECLVRLYENGEVRIVPEFDTGTLEGMRKFFVQRAMKFRIPFPIMTDKERGTDWFTIDDIKGELCQN